MRISIPREHGALLILAGAAIAAVIVAAHRDAAVGIELVIASAFLARGAIDRVAVGAPLRAWDAPWCAVLGAMGVCGAAIAMRGAAAIALATIALGAIALGGAAAARRARLQRSPYVEQGGLAALGASSALAAWAGGAGFAAAIALGAVLAAHAAASVPIVRAAVRGAARPPGVVGAVAAIAIAAIACGIWSRPWAALALLPRAAQLALLSGARGAKTSPSVIGVRETVLLALVIAAAVAAV